MARANRRETPAASAAAFTDQPSSTMREIISARLRGVRRAFLWMFIRGVPVEVECRNPSFVQTPPRVNNLRSFGT